MPDGARVSATSHRFHALAREGLTQAELDFAKDNALGSMPFEQATARRRLQISIENKMYGLAEDFEKRSEERIRDIRLQEVNDALTKCLADRGVVTSVLCTADNVRSDFEARVGPCEVVAYDSY